ncbi:MAG: DEAD/DEAH box helicase [Candidatus Puniceispirillales bacterium]
MPTNKLDKFENLGLSKNLTSSLNFLGYKEPTPIQIKSIPLALMGRDILGCAQTGTGKTASFVFPIIDILNSQKGKARMPRALILSPTRELADQISEYFKKLYSYHKLSVSLLIGGIPLNEQDKELNKGVDILIATPGRLIDHINRGNILFNDLKILVIDEADRMLDMGFIPDIELISDKIPKIRQTLFFSATLSKEILKIGKKFVINPKLIEVSPPSSASVSIDQSIVKCKSSIKLSVLEKVLVSLDINNTVIFCNRKKDIDILSRYLTNKNFQTISFHGDLVQTKRNQALNNFKNGFKKIMIASDVAGRGLDVENISHVINYDVPNNPEDYVHRIGRTGRAGKKGVAVTLVTKEDFKSISEIESLIKQKIKTLTLSLITPTLDDYNYDTLNSSDHIPNFLKR